MVGSRRTAVFLASIAATSMLAAPLASAQESSVAEQLFIEGKALSAQHDYEKACAKFKASHDLDPTATGTLLNLALCHEQIGKAATAWAEFRQVAAESTGRREDRVTMARDHEAKLRPLLAHITLIVPPKADVAGLSLRLDGGAPIAPAGWDTPIPVDPGEHFIEASAPAKITGMQRFVVGSAGTSAQVIVLALADAPLPITQRDRSRRTIAYTIGGAGIVAVGVGAVFGLNASSKNRQAKSMCSSDEVCPDEPTRQSASNALASAHTSATVANIAIGGGLVLIAGAAVLWLTAPKVKSPSAAVVRPTPVIVQSGGGLGVVGAF